MKETVADCCIYYTNPSFLQPKSRLLKQNCSMYRPYEYIPVYSASPAHPDYSHSRNHTRSNKSSKCSSRKGSTDIDSKLKFKTEVCKYWTNSIDCPYGLNCNFAHGDEEMRCKDNLPSKYKTRICNRFNQEGYCPYGYRCQFIHCTHKNPRVLHEAVLECLGEGGMLFSFLEQRQRNTGRSGRLEVFEKICGMARSSADNWRDQIVYEQAEENQNYVDVRSRHNSF